MHRALYLGVDLGTSAAQSAVAAYWPETGRLESVAAFPCEPDLAERGLRDGVGRLYSECAKRGELITAGQNAVNIGDLLADALERFGRPSLIVADRWREAELRDALTAAGVPLTDLESRGMGFKDGAEDVRSFQRAIADGVRYVKPSLSATAGAVSHAARPGNLSAITSHHWSVSPAKTHTIPTGCKHSAAHATLKKRGGRISAR